MRQSLIFNALEVIGYNYKNGEPNVRIFEFGKVYKSMQGSFKEEENLVIALSGLQNKEHWINSKSEVLYSLILFCLNIQSSLNFQHASVISFHVLSNLFISFNFSLLLTPKLPCIYAYLFFGSRGSDIRFFFNSLIGSLPCSPVVFALKKYLLNIEY